MPPILLIFINDIDYFMLHWLIRAKAAQKAGYEVHVAASSLVGDQIRIEQEGLFFHSIPLTRRGTSIAGELSCLISIYKLLRKLGPSLLHNITIKPVIYGGIAARLAAVPAVVSTIPGLGYMFADSKGQNRLLQFLIKFSYRLALKHGNSSIIFENGDDRNELVSSGTVTAAQSVVIKGAGVDMSVYTPQDAPQGVPLVMLAARMIWSKGVGEFVEAAKYLHAEGVSARFVLIGESDRGNPAAIPTAQLQQWHDLGAVEWWGQRTDMPEVLAAASIVCLPTTYREGVPRVLIEAAACGKPIITTDAPGCRDIVKNGENGLLVPPRDIASLAEAIRKLIENPLLRKTMGASGRKLAVEVFSEETVIQETLAVYRKLLLKSGTPASELTAPKTILYFVAEDWYFCSHRLHLAKEAKRRGYHVVVATKVSKHGSCITDEGFELIPLNMSRKSLNPLRALLTVIKVISILGNQKPDIVHNVGMKPVLYGGFAAIFVKVPTVVHALAGLGHIFSVDTVAMRVIRKFVLVCFRYLFRRPATRIIFQNEYDRQLFVCKGVVGLGASAVIRGSGVDMSRFRPMIEPSGVVTVILACRMLLNKGVECFYEAARTLHGRGVQARFVLVGTGDEGSLGSIHSTQLSAWRDSGEVEWWGYQEDMLQVFAAAHIICLPSTYGEGVPMVLIEAAACGRPIVTTDMPGCRDVVQNGVNGFLVPPHNCEALADAIQKLIFDPQLRQQMGVKGRQLAEKEFPLDKICNETFAIYGGEI